MGCDIHTIVEWKKDGKWEPLHMLNVFDYRNYAFFGWLANVRNYSESPFIQQSRGFPADASEYCKGESYEGYKLGEHNQGYVTLKELLDYDYGTKFQDMRASETVGNITNGAARSKTGGVCTTIREHIGEWYFEQLELLKKLDSNPENIRILFGFDS